MEQMKLLPLFIIFIQTAEGFSWNSSTISDFSCEGNSISLFWRYTLNSSETLSLTEWTKSDGAGGSINLADDLLGFVPAPAYVGRLSAVGNAGIQILNSRSSDDGTYYVSVTLTSGPPYIANATVPVYVIANASCTPSCDNNDNKPKCEIPLACPVQKKYIDAVWTVEGVKYINEFTCSLNSYGKTYNACAEGKAVTYCYSGLPLCTQYKCKNAPPATGIPRPANSTSSTTTLTSGGNCADGSILGLALGVGLGNAAICIICLICIVILVKRDATDHKKGASKLILGLGFGIICVACITCIVILVMIGEQCALKLGLGLGLGLGIPFVGCIIVVILVKKVLKPQTPPPESKKSKSGSRSDVSRKDVQIQLEEKGLKNNEERPLHNRIGNKDESEIEPVLSKPFDPKERRPLPPLNEELKDKPRHRLLPIPSEKNDVQDQNLRGLSANFDDTRGLASEMPRRSKKLPPIQQQVQSAAQEEGTSEGPRKIKNRNEKDKTDEGKSADEIAK